MAQAVGTNVQLTYIAETTRGVTPGSPAMKFLRANTRNINLKKDTLESQEISPSRQRVDVRHGFNRVEASFGFELSFASYNEILAYAMARPNSDQSPAANTAATSGNYDGWLMPAAANASVTISSVTQSTTTTSGSMVFVNTNASANTNWIDLGYRPGDVVVSTGFTNSANNGTWRVMSVTATNLKVFIPRTTSGSSGQTADAAPGAGKQVDYVGRRLSIGKTLTTMTIERGFTDVPLYQVFTGCAVNSLVLNVEPTALVGGTLNIIGMTADINNTSSLDAAPDAAASNSPFAAFDGSIQFVDGSGVEIVATVTGGSVTLDNQRTLFPVVGQKTSQDVYEGVAKVSGTVSVLLESAAMLTAFQDEATLNSMTWRLNELGTSEFLNFAFDRVKFFAADINPPLNGPVIVEIPFEALEQSYTGFASAVVERTAFRVQRSS